MQSLLFKGYKTDSTDCYFFPCSYEIEALSIYFHYGYISDGYTGYAHLLEHMNIKIMQREFNKICNEGVLFNAVTKENTTEYTFINLRGKRYLESNRREIEKIFENIQISEALDDLLETEKKIILEEFSILENRFQTFTVEQMLGKKSDIEKFSVKLLADKYYTYYRKYKSILLMNRRYINEKYYMIPSVMQYDLKKAVVKRLNGNSVIMPRNRETIIIVFFLHICDIAQLGKKWKTIISEEKDAVRIKIKGDFLIGDKRHILNRYWLLCTNLKVYIDEIGYLINNDLLALDIGQAFMENWEGILYE